MKTKAELKRKLRELQTDLENAKNSHWSASSIINLRKDIMRTVNKISHLTSVDTKPTFIPKFVPRYGVRRKKEA